MTIKRNLIKAGIATIENVPWASKKGLEIIIRNTTDKASSNPMVREDAYTLYQSMTNAVVDVLSDPHGAPAQKKAFRSFIENTMSGEIRAEIAKKIDRIPGVFHTITPTRRCNLKCVGCYATQETAQMTEHQFELIVRKGKEDMGFYFQTISGGKPLSKVFRNTFFAVAEKHPEVLFNTYTNGTFIDREIAKELAKLGNILPAISIEGDKELTDARRGAGSYDKVMAAMGYLKENNMAFINSFTHTSLNNRSFSPEFFKELKSLGSRGSWDFEYLPIDPTPNLDLLVPLEEKKKAFYRLREEIRKDPDMQNFFIGSFWKDGRQARGCMAGGRAYVHPSVFTDAKTKENIISLDPCVFIPYSTTLRLDERLERGEKYYDIIYNDPLNKEILAWQASYDNWDAPCLTRCNIRKLKDMVEKTGATLSRSQPIPLLEGKTFAGLAEYGDKWRVEAKGIAKERYGIKCNCG